MTQYQVDSEAVLSGAAAARTSMGQIQGEVASLLGHLVNLQGSWTGQAATAFQAVIAEWRATQQHVEQSMSSIDQGLVLVARQYAEVETNNARLFLH